jgi:hypothetical protein
MLKKIKRQDCLNQYPNFPLRKYNKKKDEEICFFPKTYSQYWIKLEKKTKKNFTEKLANEITKLYDKLNIDNIIFLGDTNYTWITKNSINRDDYKPLINALKYLKQNKIGKRFNGAIAVEKSEFFVFLQHFFEMTRCDASFSYYHFMDKGQNLIGSIDYCGEIQILPLNHKTDKMFLKKIGKTKFQIKD